MPKKKGMRRKMQVEWYGDDILEIVRKHGDEALFEMGKVVLTAAEHKTPRKTGKLSGSGYISTASRSTYQRRKGWRKEKKPPTNGATVGFTAPHAHLVESGRRKSGKFGPVQGKRGTGKKALKIGDRYVARSKFKRLSSKPFLGPALEDTKTDMVEALAKSLRSKLERALRATVGL
jgi:hypothetical protein